MQLSPRPLVLLLASLALAACSASASDPPDASTGGGGGGGGGGGFLPDASGGGGFLPDADLTPGVDAAPPDAALPACDSDSAFEPNQNPDNPANLDAIDDCDDNAFDIVGASINGEEDWYAFAATDAGGCSVDPTVTFSGDIQVCVYFVCDSGDTEPTCNGTSTPSTVGALTGCCGVNTYDAGMNCTGTLSEDVTTFIQVTSTSTDTCEQYSVNYHY